MATLPVNNNWWSQNTLDEAHLLIENHFRWWFHEADWENAKPFIITVGDIKRSAGGLGKKIIYHNENKMTDNIQCVLWVSLAILMQIRFKIKQWVRGLTAYGHFMAFTSIMAEQCWTRGQIQQFKRMVLVFDLWGIYALWVCYLAVSTSPVSSRTMFFWPHKKTQLKKIYFH